MLNSIAAGGEVAMAKPGHIVLAKAHVRAIGPKLLTDVTLTMRASLIF
jgi:hypothetical protein